MADEPSLASLYARRRRLRKRLHDLGPLLRGSVVVLARPCTNPRCRKCRDGTKHPATYHSVSKASRTQLTYVAKVVREEATEWNENWRELLSIADELMEVNLEILKRKAKRDRG